jgi:hypothetical protein
VSLIPFGASIVFPTLLFTVSSLPASAGIECRALPPAQRARGVALWQEPLSCRSEASHIAALDFTFTPAIPFSLDSSGEGLLPAMMREKPTDWSLYMGFGILVLALTAIRVMERVREKSDDHLGLSLNADSRARYQRHEQTGFDAGSCQAGSTGVARRK